ncbi:hypothetical protein FLL45_09085 [Aliikangiella marina]|uniref:Uncharacterized protein n=1 Tax=Aliikangiella marina TaxID=1712262 RepID=A0A545TCZ1_9GAMM|nr:hypothetical protein [Aliikangiella marina]TQV75085.1 hypothetical protein FLL45_09085 [Aliikangiella marina]
MLIKTIPYAMAATAGFIVAYVIFGQPKTEPQNPLPERIPTITKPETASDSTAFDRPIQVPSPSNLEQSQSELEQLRRLVDTQASKINSLEAALEQYATKESAESDSPPKGLETISMDDFENRMKGSFRNRFKGVAIELKPEQIKEFNRMFDANSQKSEWGVEYENRITNFIANSDPNGLHFIEEVNCINHMCRLKVQSSEAADWQNLYSNMTNENWFNSMTLVEKSDIPGMHIYYIPKPQEM